MAKRKRRQRIARAAAAAAPAQVAAPAPAPPTPRPAPKPAAKKATRKVVGENGDAKPVVVEMAPEEDIVVTVNYDGMTKSELQELCDAKEISYGRMTTKSTLIKLLKG